MPRLSTDQVIDQLWKPRAGGDEPQLYAIVDGARDERIYPAVQSADVEHCCLYLGELHPELAKAAPYLLKPRPDARFTAWLIDNGWGESWGIFAVTSADMKLVRRHFRKFLMVYDEDRKPLYFRYYDPRVLRIFLPTCTPDELSTVFGPVEQYVVEAKGDAAPIYYALSDAQLLTSNRG